MKDILEEDPMSTTLDEYVAKAIPVNTMINFYGTKKAAIDEYNF